MTKLFTTLLLIFSILALTTLPRNFVSADDVQPDNLKIFLAETEKINAKYEYPNYHQTPQAPEKIKIPAHTPIIIKNKYRISADKIGSGDQITFATTNPLKSKDGRILINANSPVEATINFNKTKRIGKAGDLTITDFHVNAADGTYIPLSSSIYVQGDDCMALSIVLSIIICPLFLLMKGGEATLPPNTTKTVYTVTDVYVTPAGAAQQVQGKNYYSF